MSKGGGRNWSHLAKGSIILNTNIKKVEKLPCDQNVDKS